MDSVLQEFKAVQYFVEVFKTRSRPSKSQDAHCLLVNNQQVKTYLQSKWKLSELGLFFRKYSRYFKVELDGSVFLKNPDFNIDELECVGFFVELLMKRQNRPILDTSAACFVTVSSVEEFLRTNYHLPYLVPFFVNHRDFFLVRDGFISLKNFDEDTAPTKVAEVPTESPKTLSKEEKAFNRKMDKLSVEFYVKIIKEREEISVKQAHSYLQTETELRDYLRNNYQLSNLAPFFEKHPDVFLLVGENARLNPATGAPKELPKPLSNGENKYNHKVEKASVDFYVKLIKERGEVSVMKAHSYLGDETELRDYLRMNYKISNLAPFFKKHPEVFLLVGEMARLIPVAAPVAPLAASQPAVTKTTKPPEPKQPKPKQQDLSSQTRSNVSTPSWQSNQIPVSDSPDVSYKKGKNVNIGISNNENLSTILSLLMPHSTLSSEDKPSSNVVAGFSQVKKFQDACCQTLSTGPILSLSVMQELRNS